MMEKKTFKVVDIPRDDKLLPCRWVFTFKENGNLFKARLVTGGHRQVEGMDYDNVFASVATNTTIRSLLALATAMDWEVKQIDYKTAFLNGKVESDIYMRIPDGAKKEEGKCWKLKGSINECKVHRYGRRKWTS